MQSREFFIVEGSLLVKNIFTDSIKSFFWNIGLPGKINVFGNDVRIDIFFKCIEI